MTDTIVFWDELTQMQRATLATVYPTLPPWLQVRRARASTILTLWQHERPVGYSVMTHDRLRIATAVVDVATIRIQHLESTVDPAYNVELAMTQAGAALEEGIGIVLVQGHVSQWAPYGFAPISLEAHTTWPVPSVASQPQPGTIEVGPTDANLSATLADISRARPTGAVDCIDWDEPQPQTWLVLRSRDHQIRAAAQIDVVDSRVVCRSAVASDDGAANDLVDALCATYDSTTLDIRVAPSHSVARMALYSGAQMQITAAQPYGVLAGIIDLPTMLHALVPAFTARIAASTYRDWIGGVRIEISDERAMIMLNAGVVTIIDGTREAAVRLRSVELSALSQLCFGYRSVSALRRAGLLACDDTELAICELLFPSLSPVVPPFRRR